MVAITKRESLKEEVKNRQKEFTETIKEKYPAATEPGPPPEYSAPMGQEKEVPEVVPSELLLKKLIEVP